MRSLDDDLDDTTTRREVSREMTASCDVQCCRFEVVGADLWSIKSRNSTM